MKWPYKDCEDVQTAYRIFDLENVIIKTGSSLTNHEYVVLEAGKGQLNKGIQPMKEKGL